MNANEKKKVMRLVAAAVAGWEKCIETLASIRDSATEGAHKDELTRLHAEHVKMLKAVVAEVEEDARLVQVAKLVVTDA